MYKSFYEILLISWRMSPLEVAAVGRISGVQVAGLDQDLLVVRCLPKPCRTMVGTRASLLVRAGAGQGVLITAGVFESTFGRRRLVRGWLRHSPRRLRGCESCCLVPPS